MCLQRADEDLMTDMEGPEGENLSMGELRRRPYFTLPARRIWANIPEPIQRKLLDNVWCRTCRRATTMVKYSGQIKEGDLVLTGICAACGQKIVRLVESE